MLYTLYFISYILTLKENSDCKRKLTVQNFATTHADIKLIKVFIYIYIYIYIRIYIHKFLKII